VLESFTPRKQQLSLAELTKAIDAPKSSLYRILKTLCRVNYLRYDELNKRYSLGTKVLSLGFSVLQNMELREVARPLLEAFSRDCNKTVNLAVLDKNEMVYIERVRVPSIRQFNISIGSRIPVWNTAMGKVVLANLDPARLNKILDGLKRYHKDQINEKRLMKDLANVRKHGIAVNDQDYLRGIRAIAVPVFGEKGVVCGINLVSEPEEGTITELKRKYGAKLIKLGRELSEALGFRAKP
jgi:IclR family KDG regulon transcriptional repressor